MATHALTTPTAAGRRRPSAAPAAVSAPLASPFDAAAEHKPQPTDDQIRTLILAVLDLVDEQLPEGVHTGLRKAAVGTTASEAWQAVRQLSSADWRNACLFATNPFRNMWLDETVKTVSACLAAGEDR
jgi:hypothetical protein